MAEGPAQTVLTGAVFGGLATAQTDNVCASGRNGRLLDARSIFDGLAPAKLLRNSGQVEQAEGLPRSAGSKSGVAGLAGHTAFDDGATQQRSCGRRQDARTANMAESEGKPWHATDSIRALHFWGGGPRKCGVLRRARAGDGPGAKLLPAADYDRAGHMDDGDSKRPRRT